MNVQHDETRHAFTVDVDGEQAELTYTRPSEGVIDLNHTFVPVAGRNKGVAAEMAKAALAYARESSLKVIPTCPYIGSFLKKHHSEYGSLIARAV